MFKRKSLPKLGWDMPANAQIGNGSMTRAERWDSAIEKRKDLLITNKYPIVLQFAAEDIKVMITTNNDNLYLLQFLEQHNCLEPEFLPLPSEVYECKSIRDVKKKIMSSKYSGYASFVNAALEYIKNWEEI